MAAFWLVGHMVGHMMVPRKDLLVVPVASALTFLAVLVDFLMVLKVDLKVVLVVDLTADRKVLFTVVLMVLLATDFTVDLRAGADMLLFPPGCPATTAGRGGSWGTS